MPTVTTEIENPCQFLTTSVTAQIRQKRYCAQCLWTAVGASPKWWKSLDCQITLFAAQLREEWHWVCGTGTGHSAVVKWAVSEPVGSQSCVLPAGLDFGSGESWPFLEVFPIGLCAEGQSWLLELSWCKSSLKGAAVCLSRGRGSRLSVSLGSHCRGNDYFVLVDLLEKMHALQSSVLRALGM